MKLRAGCGVRVCGAFSSHFGRDAQWLLRTSLLWEKTGGKNVRVRVGALYMGARHGELVLECARSMRISGSAFERVLDGQSGWDDQ